MTDEGTFLEKKILQPKLRPNGRNQAQNEVFRHFLAFVSLVFREIDYNDNVQQCLMFSRGKTHGKKFLGPKFGPNEPKSGPLKWHIMIACNNV